MENKTPSNKILCLIDSLNSGGAERQMSYLTTGLQERGYDVRLIVFSPGKGFYEDYISERGVKVEHNITGSNPYKRIFEIIKLVKKHQPMAVIAYKDGVTIAASIARIFKHFYLIVSERNTTQFLTKREKIKFILYKFADKIIPNSFSQFNFISQNYPTLKNKMTVITNMIDSLKFRPISTLHEPSKKVRFVTTARLMKQKNVLNFIDAVKILKDRGYNHIIEFKWIGQKILTDNYYQLIEEALNKSKTNDLVSFLPPISEVEKTYNDADIFCLPSIYEGFPNVICEAMACGLPVVASNVCDNPNIVEDGVNGFLFDPLNPVSIADAMEKMINLSTSERAKMGVINVNKIKELCSKNSFIDSYIRIIETN